MEFKRFRTVFPFQFFQSFQKQPAYNIPHIVEGIRMRSQLQGSNSDQTIRAHQRLRHKEYLSS